MYPVGFQEREGTHGDDSLSRVGAMKGGALSTGCPGLLSTRVKDSRVPREIDLIYATPFPATD